MLGMSMNRRTKGGTRGTLYKALAKMRLEDARILLGKQRNHGAFYLAGYAVECALKWAITVRMEKINLPPDLEVHDLGKLIAAAGLVPHLQNDLAVRVIFFGVDG